MHGWGPNKVRLPVPVVFDLLLVFEFDVVPLKLASFSSPPW
jgi:hypothetical protein